MTDGNTRFTFTTSIPVIGSVSQNQTEWIAPQIILLGSVSLIGVLGNLLVIFSIIHSKKLHRHGNIFFVNLAAADLLVRILFFHIFLSLILLWQQTTLRTLK